MPSDVNDFEDDAHRDDDDEEDKGRGRGGGHVLFCGEEFPSGFESCKRHAMPFGIAIHNCPRDEVKRWIQRYDVAVPLMTRVDEDVLEGGGGAEEGRAGRRRRGRPQRHAPRVAEAHRQGRRRQAQVHQERHADQRLQRADWRRADPAELSEQRRRAARRDVVSAAADISWERRSCQAELYGVGR